MLVLTLTLLAALPAATPAAKSATDPMRVKCRSRVETGSLVKRAKICRTLAEWRKLDEDESSAAYRAVDQGAISCGECKGGS